MPTKNKEKYTEAVGRRKTSTARVRITPASKQSIVINEKTLEEYFPTDSLRATVISPFEKTSFDEKFTITVKVLGGGASSQSEAIRHGISRAIIDYNPEMRKELKKLGYLKRDPRMKERRKFGLKKARKRAQWSKR